MYAAQQFSKFFTKFSEFLRTKEDSVVTEKDIQRFFESIKLETPSAKNDSGGEEGERRKQQEGS